MKKKNYEKTNETLNESFSNQFIESLLFWCMWDDWSRNKNFGLSNFLGFLENRYHVNST